MTGLDLTEAIRTATLAVAADGGGNHPITAAVTAAAPVIERQVRERIAAGLQHLARHTMDADIQEGLDLLHTLAAGQLPGIEVGAP